MGIENKEQQNKDEREQTPEEILEVVKEAIESGKDVLLTQSKENGGSITNPATPISIDGNRLEIDSCGYGFSLDIGQIIKAQIVEPEDQK